MPRRAYIRAGAVSPIRVSLPGYDVENASLPELAFDAASRCFYPFLKGTVSLNLPGEVTVNFPESLPEVPFCRWILVGQVQATTGRYWARSGQPLLASYARVTKSEVKFITNFGTGNVAVRFMLFKV